MSSGMDSPSNVAPTQPVSSAAGAQPIGGSGSIPVPPLLVAVLLVLEGPKIPSVLPPPTDEPAPPTPFRDPAGKVPPVPAPPSSPLVALEPPEPQPTSAAQNHPPSPSTPYLML